MSADMSPYCLAHDERMIMKLACMSGTILPTMCQHFGGDPVNQFNFKKR